MGKGFGNLAYVRNQVWFSLSPYEQKPFAKFFKAGIPNTIRRCSEEFPFVLPPLLLGYAIFAWTKGEAERMSRKAYGAHH
jgi:ubiquinol-cytochrome c reductase subunit 8